MPHPQGKFRHCSDPSRIGDKSMSGKNRKKLKGSPGGLGGMVSAMIPGAKVDDKGRVMVNVATAKETITFNIGGTLFETYRSTLFRLPNSPLSNDKFLADHYRPERKDYFFDRDPDIFRATLNYLRTGELHIPSYICGPAAKTELEFWGVVPNRIERCCWTNYNDWNSTLHALNQLDHDRKGVMMACDLKTGEELTWWNKYRPRIWNFLNNPHSSVGANILGFISLVVVVLSIFSFIADTTESFAVYTTIPYMNTTTNNSVFESNTTTVATTFVNESSTSGSVDMTLSSSDNGTSDGYTFRIKHPSLQIIDLFCLIVFTVEYVLHLIFAPRRLKYITSIMGVIDLIAILPDYLEIIVYAARPDLIFDAEARNVIAMLHLSRVLRVFRLIRHVPGLWILVYTFKASLGELVLLACFMVLGILLFSSLIYYAEDRDNIPSIPEAFWWAIITMTTVGYGDMYPVTTAGKLIGSMCAMSGLLMIGFSVPALVNNFMLFYKHVQYAIQAERNEESDENENESKSNGFQNDGQNGHGSVHKFSNDTEMKPLVEINEKNEIV